MRHSKATIQEATKLIDAMRRGDVPAFSMHVLGLAERELLQDMINRAKRHHTIQERWCSEEMTEETTQRLEAKEEALEREIREAAAKFGLKVHFDGDPRGFTVKLHAPKGNVWNTWGGAETGYGIGDSSHKE